MPVSPEGQETMPSAPARRRSSVRKGGGVPRGLGRLHHQAEAGAAVPDKTESISFDGADGYGVEGHGAGPEVPVAEKDILPLPGSRAGVSDQERDDAVAQGQTRCIGVQPLGDAPGRSGRDGNAGVIRGGLGRGWLRPGDWRRGLGLATTWDEDGQGNSEADD